mgnify:CR=1 FL=1|jgi:exodeoxyribonuclease VII small subunit
MSEKLSFEESMTRLEDLVNQLESGDMPLDEALKAFEQGITLVKGCQKKLSQAEMKVQKILQDEGTVTGADAL